jgi:integrase
MTDRFQFTKDALDKLKCPADKSDVMVYDLEEKCLAVRITRAGSKTFFVVRKLGGKVHRINLGAFDKDKTKLIPLRLRAKQTFAGLEEAIVVASAKAETESITLGSAFKSMMSAKSKITAVTIADYEKTYKNYLKKYEGRPLVSISNEDVIKMHDEFSEPLIKSDGTPGAHRFRSANKAIVLLGSIYRFTIVVNAKQGKKRIDHNPVDIMKTLKLWNKNNRSKIRVNPGELPELISECLRIANTPPMRDVPTSFKCVSAAVLFMLFTGVRPGEVSKIKKSYVHHATRSIIFPERNAENELDTLKNGKEFHLVLSDTAYCQLVYSMQYSDSEYVFSGVKKPRLGESSVRDFLLRIENKIGKHLPRKILRASFISLAEAADVGAFQTKILCNHDGQGQTVDVTDGYKTAYLDEVRISTNKIESKIYELSMASKVEVCRGLLESIVQLDENELKRRSVTL